MEKNNAKSEVSVAILRYLGELIVIPGPITIFFTSLFGQNGEYIKGSDIAMAMLCMYFFGFGLIKLSEFIGRRKLKRRISKMEINKMPEKDNEKETKDDVDYNAKFSFLWSFIPIAILMVIALIVAPIVNEKRFKKDIEEIHYETEEKLNNITIPKIEIEYVNSLKE